MCAYCDYCDARAAGAAAAAAAAVADRASSEQLRQHLYLKVLFRIVGGWRGLLKANKLGMFGKGGSSVCAVERKWGRRRSRLGAAAARTKQSTKHNNNFMGSWLLLKVPEGRKCIRAYTVRWQPRNSERCWVLPGLPPKTHPEPPCAFCKSFRYSRPNSRVCEAPKLCYHIGKCSNHVRETGTVKANVLPCFKKDQHFMRISLSS